MPTLVQATRTRPGCSGHPIVVVRIFDRDLSSIFKESQEGRPKAIDELVGEYLLMDTQKVHLLKGDANIAVVKEFYTNARQLGDYPTKEYTSYVRGHTIRYDPDSINRFLNTEWAGEQCQFALSMEEGADFVDVESVLCVPGWHFQRNRNDAVVNIRRAYLTPLAKYWMTFSHANIQPCLHVSDITVNRALLLYCVLRGMTINIGQVIANEIQVCVNTMNNKAPLGHPSLITHLCELVGVNISTPTFERPRKAIDEAYYRQYCGEDEAAQPVPPCHPRRGRGPPQAPAQPHDAEPFQMRDMYMSLIDARMQSIHRGQVATTEMIIEMYDTPPGHRWTMDEFNNVVAWQEDQAQASGAGAAEAPAMDDDEDDFEDAEEEGEEEDSDDNMG
ncbi:hypothetical protein LR48_Vigan04g120800 [Vigna angularis]|uniref:Putative plant transposon protein domain-containing protein n=1 Tax=Phaseolus angularis TaxID=3914 RepID=A0A0L9UDM8_PHAAN|nr:hypothetical protein LR48_Vigan04g120800 [Vigna angularis]